MTVSRRRRQDPRSLATRTALIETAETMFAEAGLDAVSTRQIGAAIGSSNNGVVAYHFGGKEALVEAIYRHRMTKIEARRAQLLAEAEAKGNADDMTTILTALWLPLFEQVNESGQHTYARFLSSMMREGIGRTRHIVRKDYPTALALVDRLKDGLPFDSGSIGDMRWLLATNMVLDALRHIDVARLGTSAEAEQHFNDALLMAKAALTAPTYEPSAALQKQVSRAQASRTCESDRSEHPARTPLP